MQLSRLVDDLMDVSRITRGQIRLERRRVDLGRIVHEAADTLRDSCDQKRHSLVVEHQAGVRVRGDAVRLTQVFNNLIHNACKYTPDGGRIEVRMSVEGDQARVSVRDTGIGISPSLLPRVFDVFTQDMRALDRSQGGLGLGLTICKRLVEMHRGTVVARSAGPGCGSEFVVTLPIVPVPIEFDDELAPEALTVLVVDDNVDAAYCLQELLRLNGHRTLVAFDGEAALAMASTTLPDVILLDIGLPRVNGYEVARAIRGMRELEGVILVAVTGYSSEEDRRRSMEVGFDAHVAKPVDYEALQRQVPALAPARATGDQPINPRR